MKTATLEQVRKAKGKQSALYLVKVSDQILGMVEKYGNSRTDKHPWKAFSGHGMATKFLAAFYPEDGGKDAAIARVLA